MQDLIYLGPTPSEEDCAQVGSDDYRSRARAECARYIALIRKSIGPEPAGAKLAIKASPHDFGSYFEAVCYFDDSIEGAIDYALRCESQVPTRWEESTHAN